MMVLTVSDLANCSMAELIQRIKSGERASSAWDCGNRDPVQDFIDVFYVPIHEFSSEIAKYQNSMVRMMTGLTDKEIAERRDKRKLELDYMRWDDGGRG